MGIHFDTGVQNRVVTDSDIVTDSDVRIDLHTLAQPHVLADIRKRAYICILGHRHTFADEGRLLDALLARVHRLGHQLQQLPHRTAGVIHQYDRTAGFAFSFREGNLALHDAARDEHHACFGRRQVRQVFLFGYKRQMVRLRLLDGCNVTHLGIRIAVQCST